MCYQDFIFYLLFPERHKTHKKNKSPACLNEQHAIRTYGESRGIAQHTLKFDI
jgi:hypothetical protein